MLKKFFSIDNDKKYHKIITILGFKIKLKNLSKFIDYKIKKIYDLESCVKSCSYIAPPFGPAVNSDELELYKNLDEEAISNLSRILSTNKKASAISFFEKRLPTIAQLYSEEEIKQIDNLKNFQKEITKGDGYFQYKNFKLPINFFAPEVFIYKHGCETLKNPDYIKNKVIIDAGAFIGDSMLIFKDLFPDNLVISFEPLTKMYKLMLQTIKLNNLENVKAENYALGDKSSTVYSDNTIEYPYLSQTRSEKYCHEINTITLDDYVKNNNLNVGLIKTDIEGFEQQLLKGGGYTIRTQKPTLVISIYHNYEDFFKIKPIIEGWNLGYRFDFFRGPDGRTTFADTMLICEQPKI